MNAQTLSEMDADQRKSLFKDYMLYISKDAVRRVPLNNSKAIKKVLGFRSGLVSFGMMVSTTRGLGLETVK